MHCLILLQSDVSFLYSVILSRSYRSARSMIFCPSVRPSVCDAVHFG